jgi:hypothetical protein
MPNYSSYRVMEPGPYSYEGREEDKKVFTEAWIIRYSFCVMFVLDQSNKPVAVNETFSPAANSRPSVLRI